MAVANVLVQLLLSVFVTAWVVRRDMKRLTAEQLARCWNDASLWVAVVAFGPFCLPVHFVKSRRSVAGGLLGVIWMVAVFVALGVVGSILGELSGPGETL